MIKGIEKIKRLINKIAQLENAVEMRHEVLIDGSTTRLYSSTQAAEAALEYPELADEMERIKASISKHLRK